MTLPLAALLSVEIVWAQAPQPLICTVMLPVGATVSDALVASGWFGPSPQLPADHGLAVFGRSATLHTPLCHQDRVEVLRPLAADPKQVRRVKVQEVRRARRRASNFET